MPNSVSAVCCHSGVPSGPTAYSVRLDRTTKARPAVSSAVSVTYCVQGTSVGSLQGTALPVSSSIATPMRGCSPTRSTSSRCPSSDIADGPEPRGAQPSSAPSLVDAAIPEPVIDHGTDPEPL